MTPYTIEVSPHGALTCLTVCDGDKPIAAIGIPWELVVVIANAVETGSADVARLPQAIRKPLAAEISAAEVAHQDERLAPYGDVGALLHAEPAGYPLAFRRVMDEMAAIEEQARANP